MVQVSYEIVGIGFGTGIAVVGYLLFDMDRSLGYREEAGIHFNYYKNGEIGRSQLEEKIGKLNLSVTGPLTLYARLSIKRRLRTS